ncbi:hypothetical protein [Gracilibacillus boraciitolerans]|nr:hypothetical protein [Gracilibacillus boraciitolerans]
MHIDKQRKTLTAWQKVVYFFVLPFIAVVIILGFLGLFTFNSF